MILIFTLIAFVTLAGAVFAMSLRNLVHCALCLMLAFGGLAVLFLQLGAQSVFVGSGIFKSADPGPRAKAIVEATTHFRDPEIIAKVSRGLGQPMKGEEIDRLEVKLAERGW